MKIHSKVKPPNTKTNKPLALKANFGLSKAEFQKHVESLKNGDNSLILNCMLNQLQDSILYLQKKFSVSKEHSYDICMSTFVEFMNKILQNKITYGNLRFLYSRMCVNNLIDEVKKKRKIQEATNNYLKQSEDNPDTSEFLKILETIIIHLNDKEKHLITQIYYSGKPMQLIAEDHNLSYSNLRKKKQRIVEKLRELFYSKNNNLVDD